MKVLNWLIDLLWDIGYLLQAPKWAERKRRHEWELNEFIKGVEKHAKK